ncbi:MAG TPA: hypothetical protein VMF62_05045 [Acetobacteraceae bacterium]|nr:hypothetical protein [Acetobacteraceae bacterium]
MDTLVGECLFMESALARLMYRSLSKMDARAGALRTAKTMASTGKSMRERDE